MAETTEDRSARESASKVVDKLIDQGAAHGIEVSESIIRKIRKAITKDTPPLEILSICRRILTESQPAMMNALNQSMLASWLTGGQNVLKSLPSSAEPPVVPPSRVLMPGMEHEPGVRYPVIEEAAANLAGRQVMSAADYYHAESAIREKAFTVSNVESMATLEKIRGYLVEDVERGGTLRQFEEFMREETPLGRPRIETVYRNNIGTGFERGQEAVINHPLVQSEFPYVMNAEIHDSRLTELCRTISKSGLDGTSVFRVQDKVWQHFKPLRHHGCRCSSVFLNVADAAARGVKEAQRWLETGIEPQPPQFVDWPNVELPNGWTPGGQL